MTRIPHYIRPNHSSETPQLAIWFDTETDQVMYDANTITHVLRFGWAACRRRHGDGRWSNPEWFRFEDAREFWLWVDNKTRLKTRCWACCHNSNFDLPVLRLFEALPEIGYTLKWAVIEAPPTICKFTKDKKSITVWDTLNIWRMPLDKLGEQIGIPKLDMPGIDASSEEWDIYGRRDVEVIMQACLLWWDMLSKRDMGGFAPTLASQSMRIFRHRHMRHNIFIDTNEKALALSRAGYNGGRTECFRIGHVPGPLLLYDVNSMYPAVMLDNLYPTKLIGYTERATTDDLKIWQEYRCVIAKVQVDTLEPAFPLRHEGKLIFPTGRFDTVLVGPELRYGLELGAINRIYAVACYDCAPIFNSFVTEMYRMRLNAAETGDNVLAWQIKILMNSLYGKFGQNGIVFETSHNTKDMSARKWKEKDLETGETIKWRQMAGLVQHEVREVESRESFPAVAAFVTSYARKLLWDIINVAGRNNVSYVDTDSLLCDYGAKARLSTILSQTSLGKLKLEGTFDDADIYGPKDYRFGSKERHKGVRRSATWISDSDISQERWSSLRTHIALGATSGPTTTRYNKHLSRTYTKGTVNPDGRVTPLIFGETE